MYINIYIYIYIYICIYIQNNDMGLMFDDNAWVAVYSCLFQHNRSPPTLLLLHYSQS